MSIQAIILETGETVIADVSEAIDKAENKSLGYKLLNPFVINLIYDKPAESSEGLKDNAVANDARVDFTPWCPLSNGREFHVERDFCRVIYDPHGNITELYINTVTHWNEYNLDNVDVNTALTIGSGAAGENAFDPEPNDPGQVIKMTGHPTDPNSPQSPVQAAPPTDTNN
tara:strand:+ start:523 stop:1035 length:513 start_codon:yes stop_codon:yes gene_type:complete